MYFNQETILFLNGEFLKAEETKMNLYLQTLHYGYGVFEGIRAYKTENGVKIFKAKEHYERLKKSSELLNIPLLFDVDALIEASYEVLEKNNLENAYIRPLVFCDPNMSLLSPEKSNVMIAAWNWGALLGDQLLKIKISSYRRPHPKSTKIEAKACGHYVNSILATTEAKKEGFDEALLLDTEDFLAEGSGANLFFEKNGKLYTPQKGNILPGITRETILELCEKLNIDCEEGKFTVTDLYAADSAFYCGTAAEVVGFQSVDDYVFPLDWANSLGKKLQQAYQNLILDKN